MFFHADMRVFTLHLVTWAAILGFGSVVHADRVVLSNGNVIEGFVTNETPSQVTVYFGAGSMTLARTRIRSIERSSEAERRALESAWKKQNFLNEKNWPEGLEDLASAFRRLQDQRLVAMEARRQIEAGEASPTRQKVRDVETRIVEACVRLEKASPKQNVDAYNQLVAENNALRAELTVLQDRLKKEATQQTGSRTRIADYLKSLSNYRTHFDNRRTALRSEKTTEERTYFFDKVDGLLKSYDQEFPATRVDITRKNGLTLVSARINGTHSCRFILDTGASVVTLSRTAAERLQLNIPPVALVQATLADGRQVEAHSVTLESIQLGSSTAHHVNAIVLPDPPGSDVDGLLGMSFLERFHIQLDGNGGSLQLRDLGP